MDSGLFIISDIMALGGIMKRLLVFLLVMLSVISNAENLDSYESKRVFDNLMDALLYGNYEKYMEDPKMYRILELDGSDEEIMEDINASKELQLNKDFQYKVLDVKESQDKSVLTLRVKYKAITDTKENVKKEYSKAIKKLGAYKKEDDIEYALQKVSENVFLAYAIARENLEFKIYEKNINVNMEKENDLWFIPKDKEREAFSFLLYSGLLSHNKIFLSEEEDFF